MNMDTEAGRDAYSNIAGQFVREWSVGFNIPSNDAIAYGRDGAETIRTITDLDWVEVSSVVRGASPSTMTIAAKSETTTMPPPEVETEPETPETETGDDQPDEPGETAPDTEQAASDTVRTRLRLMDLTLKLQHVRE